MKKNISIAIATLSLVVSFICFLKVDKELYYYGINYLKVYNDLPLNINPVFLHEFEGGFYLADEYGSIITNGNNDWANGMNLKVKKFVKYGFNKSNVVAEVYDLKGIKRFVLFSESNNARLKTRLQLSIVDGSNLRNSNSYKWIMVDEELFRVKDVLRNGFLIVFLVSLSALIYLLLKKI
ncbi:hypothetical protein MUY27_13190 [Mucilaginibacter sp. RS28]|uniref:Uncharacterized protein n=1 Tax=Mucilaginibacter straminoryzae TaxID=2932774 RepID=A0A9X1X596_9SPHI|nr:hypothetical protein [Mucilaginibacter straminoryzae]MCJ8210665.1 hypothetical protein [Mucilaginibacter straminoryzae]